MLRGGVYVHTPVSDKSVVQYVIYVKYVNHVPADRARLENWVIFRPNHNSVNSNQRTIAKNGLVQSMYTGMPCLLENSGLPLHCRKNEYNGYASLDVRLSAQKDASPFGEHGQSSHTRGVRKFA